MKKKALLRCGLVMGALAVLLCLFWAISGGFVWDRSAEWHGSSLDWNGCIYVPCHGEYHEGKTIAKTKDGWEVNEVKEDDSHTFIVVRSFLDQYLYVKEDYVIPTQGEVTAVVWDNNKITDAAFCSAVSELAAGAETDFDYETGGIDTLSDGQCMKSLYFCYDGCPVGTQYMGYMGTLDDQWVITTYISPDQRNPDGSPKPYQVSCSVIPEEAVEIISSYWK